MSEIRIPQGMRDLMPAELAAKDTLEEKTEAVFLAYGYQKISTPAIEYFTTYANAFADVKSEEMYRFFDQQGHMLVLREDMTVPIARVCASKFANAQPPFRISYCNDVFRVRHAFAGKRNEVTDCGIELIGIDESGDLEVLVTALDVMKALAGDSFQLEIGRSSFFEKACDSVHINKEDRRHLAELIDEKSLVDLEEFLKTLSLEEKAVSFFQQLPLAAGDHHIFDEVMDISFNDDLKKEVEKMQKLYEQLDQLGYGSYVTFDFGKVPHLDYYTGIIFEAYVKDIGTSVLSGGRYDNLLKKFGRDLPACGFSVKLDYLLDTSVHNQDDKRVYVYYPRGKETEAILKAKELQKDYAVCLCPWDKDEMEVVL